VDAVVALPNDDAR